MKINSISFKRAIEIKSSTNPQFNTLYRKTDEATSEIENILNSTPSTIYSDSEASKIREFFRSILNDYNGKNGITIHKTGSGCVVLLSGKDAQEIKKADLAGKKKERGIRTQKRAYYDKENKINQLSSKVDRNVFEILENGRFYKPESILHFETSSSQGNNRIKYDSIMYSNLVRTYSQQNNGHINRKILPQRHPSKYSVLQNVSYEERSLNL